MIDTVYVEQAEFDTTEKRKALDDVHPNFEQMTHANQVHSSLVAVADKSEVVDSDQRMTASTRIASQAHQ